ncbi:MAG: efflux RND transporter permease subunit, partial [Myxococcota bacterium]
APSGELINLSNLATPRVATGPVQIDHLDRARVVTLHGNVALGKSLGEAAAEVADFIADLDLPQGYEIQAAGQTKNMKETLDAVLFALGLALLATYMILAAQFNNFLHPLTIMLCAPLSLVGAFAALAIAGKTLEMMTQIGFLMLMGLVMKNGILLVDYINQLRRRGLALDQAVLEAGPTRLRPVLMTTFSTVFGMIPLATTGGEGAEFRGAMGIIVIGGLLTSMFLTLLVVPVAYTLMETGRTAASAGFERLRERSLALDIAHRADLGGVPHRASVAVVDWLRQRGERASRPASHRTTAAGEGRGSQPSHRTRAAGKAAPPAA